MAAMILVPMPARLCKARTFAAVAMLLVVLQPRSSLAAFGVTSSGGSYVVDTGAGLVFKVSQASGDVNSIVLNGVEYQSTSKNSQIASGLGAASVSAATYGTNYIKITIATDSANTVASNLTHYLMVRNGYNHIYMATYAVNEPAVGELRWITRLQPAKLTSGPVPSDNRGNTGTIESSDIFGMPDGTTRSKYYGDAATHGKDRAMDLAFCGASGTGAGVWMVYDQPRESGAGGPFFRDIQNQCGSDQEIYNYMNSGHNQTEAYRLNVLHGPYALVFNNGQQPTLPLDFSWIETGGLNLTGWVSAAGRGAVSGTVTGIPAGFQGVVGLANTNAQYYTTVTADGTFKTPLVKPGVYTVTLYKGELGVATNTTTIVAGVTNTLILASTEANPAFLFKIGEWDGAPAGFLNADNIVVMHPQDARNADWAIPPYVVETNTPDQFPAIQFRGTNSPLTVQFNLTAAQASVGHTLRIGLTCAYNGGRPKITVNNYTSGNPAASSQPSSRSFTVGTYRGNNWLYTFNVPASAFVAGQNTMTITPISGSGDLGTWLSAGWVYDCVQMDGTPISPLAPATLAATPGIVSVALSWTPVFNAVSYKITRATVSGGPYTTLATNLTTAWTDRNLPSSTPYYYVVSAVNAAGESPPSGETAATTLDPLNLVWNGDGVGNVWDINSTANFLNGGVPSVFLQSAAVTLSDAGSNNAPIILVGCVQPASLTVNAAGNYTLGGPGSLAGAGSLIKNNSGTLTLGTANTYTGPTLVNGGTLVLSDAAEIPKTPTITLAAGAILDTRSHARGGLTLAPGQSLGGNGVVRGDLTVAAGATLAPGLPIGSLTFSNNLTLAGVTALDVRKAPVTNDLLNVSGTLTFGGTLQVSLAGGTLAAGDNFRVFNAGTSTGAFAGFSFPALGAGLVWKTDLLGSLGKLWVVSTAPPTITSAGVTGGSFTLSGTGGTPGWIYYVLAATNTALPLAQWTPIATNVFDAAGDFVFTVALTPGVPQRFFRLEVP
jgi:rhamnogalacturonan endolyase